MDIEGAQPGAEPCHGGLQGGIATQPPPFAAHQRGWLPQAIEQRDAEAETGSRTELALDRQGATHFPHQLITDGQAQTGATKAAIDIGFHLLERGKEQRLLLFGDADAGIRHRDN